MEILGLPRISGRSGFPSFNYKQAIADPTLSPTYIGGELFEVENEDYGPVFDTSFSRLHKVYLRIEFMNDAADENGDRNAFFGHLHSQVPIKASIWS